MRRAFRLTRDAHALHRVRRRIVAKQRHALAAHSGESTPHSTADAIPERQFADAIDRSLKLQKILARALPQSRVQPLPGVKDITPQQWETFKTLVLAGVSSIAAAQQSFYVTAQAWKAYMRDGDKALPGTLLGEFAAAVHAVEATARGIAEARIYYDDPLPWLKAIGGPEDWADKQRPDDGAHTAPTVVFLHGILTPEKWLELYGTEEARQKTIEAATIPSKDEEGA